MNMPLVLTGQELDLDATVRLIKIIVSFWRVIVLHPSYNQIAQILEVNLKQTHIIGKMEATYAYKGHPYLSSMRKSTMAKINYVVAPILWLLFLPAPLVPL